MNAIAGADLSESELSAVSARVFRRGASSVFECRGFGPIARLDALDRLVVVSGDFALNLDLLLVDQARRFVGLVRGGVAAVPGRRRS